MSSFFEKLKRFRAGESLADQLRARRLNLILDVIERNQLVPGRGYRIQKTNSGTVLTIEGGGVSSPQAIDHPWKPYPAPWLGAGSAPGNWGLSVRLIPGTVQGRLPGNWDDVFALAADATGGWVWVKVTVDQEGVATAAEIEQGDTPPVAEQPADPMAIPSILYQPLFSFDSNETTVTRFYIATNRNLTVGVDVSRPACGDYYRRAELRVV